MTYKSMETLMDPVPKGAAAEEFHDSSREKYEQLGKRIQQVNKLLVKWKLQPRDNNSSGEMDDPSS